MPDEPPVGAPDVSEIVFRMPGSGQRVSRRFLKTDKVDLLYTYVLSLDGDAFELENESKEFKIL